MATGALRQGVFLEISVLGKYKNVLEIFVLREIEKILLEISVLVNIKDFLDFCVCFKTI